jgi:hypothetical protein
MACSKRMQSPLASRLGREYELLRLIERRRVKEGKPHIGRAVEERIIQRNLEELER